MSDNSNNTRLYALIIGIDEYTIGTPKLMGAVADANKMYNWIVNTLRVPTSRVQVLRNAEATRKAIIRALKALATNDEIQSGDPILIYYAGHGSEGPAPAKWHWDSTTIQMILPYDYKYTVSPKTVQGIPDRTLGFLISEIASKKGDNITVIFDCCNSGSGTRSGSQGDRIRGVEYEGQIPEDLDDEYLQPGTRGVADIPQSRYYGLKSHVLLAACASHERAHENDRSGRFTEALLKTLSTADISELTYEGLINSLDTLHSQTPQCEGVNQGRVLFNKKIPNTNAILKAKLTEKGLRIQGAGSIHGIEPGRTFSVWGSRADIKGQPLTVVTICKVLPYSSTAKWDPGSRSQLDFVVQLTGNPKFKLPVHASEVIQGLPFYEELFIDTQSKTQSVELVSKDKATIGLIYTEGGRIGFEMLDVEEKRQVITQTAPPDVDELRQALQHISNYYHHLNRTSDKKPPVDERPLSSQFSLEVYKVDRNDDDDDDDDDEGSSISYKAIGSNLSETGGLVITVGQDKEQPDEDHMYGFKIHNQTENINMYPYLFYFDSSTFSVAPIDSPATVAQSRSPGPLGPGKSLSIGYGSSGIPPQHFFLSNKNLGYERGYLRLYLSTKRVNLSSITQGELFGGTRGLKPAAPSTGPPFWDSITIPVTFQRVVPTPTNMIGVIGCTGSGKDEFLAELFKPPHFSRAYKFTEYSPVKEYRLNLTVSKKWITVVDLPGLEKENIDQQLEALKAIAAYAKEQYEHGRQFISLIWCYNISSGSPITAEAALNWNFVKNIAGREMLNNTVILTTGWNTSNTNTRPGPSLASGIPNLQPHPRLEHELEKCCAELVREGAEFKRLDFHAQNDASGDGDRFVAPLALISSLLERKAQKFQFQREMRDQEKLSATTAWVPLSRQINKAIQDLNEQLEEGDQLDDDAENVINGRIKKMGEDVTGTMTG